MAIDFLARAARRNSTDWVVKISAKSAHSSQFFSDNVVVGAAYEPRRVLNSFYEQVRGEVYSVQCWTGCQQHTGEFREALPSANITRAPGI